jgi:hypothetical protein
VRVAAPLQVTFAGGATGQRRVDRMGTVRGDDLEVVDYVAVLEGPQASVPRESAWAVRGVTSYER